MAGFWDVPGPPKIDKKSKKSCSGRLWNAFEILDCFRDGFRKVWGESWEGFGKVLRGFWEGFGRVFEIYWEEFG